MKQLTQGGLFEGIGGFPLSATWAGIKPIWSNEIDPWCCKVLRKNFDHEIIEKDIRLLNSDTNRDGKRAGEGRNQSKRETTRECPSNNGENRISIPRPDILTGGFPCQPFSHAGKRKGKDDNRYLWPEYLRLIRELQPPWIIAENVAGLISMENGRTLEGILIDLENENYMPEIYNIPACGVGAWHKRERIWIVSKRNNSNPSCTNSNGIGSHRAEIDKQGKTEFRYKQECEFGQMGKDVSGPTNRRCEKRKSKREPKRNASIDCGKTGNQWEFEPAVGRVANGIPGRVDRLKGLGNAIVPQVAYEIFKAIVDYESR